MTASLIQFLISAAVIVVAGVALAQFADLISERTKLGGLLVGSILLAGATSLPELAIDINAVRLGTPDLAVGDLMGSSLFNLLILAVLDRTRYSRGRMLSPESAGHALTASLSVALTAIAALFILAGPRLESVTIIGIGPGPIALAIAYLAGVRLVYFAQKATMPKARAPEAKEPAGWIGGLNLKGGVTGYIVSGAAILVAAPFLARAAGDLAVRSGLGGTFFGTTFVAFCTSLPEMVTTFTAVRMKAFDLALGNIFGSNCFNMMAMVPLDFVHQGSLLSAVAPTHVHTALSVIVVTTLVILGQLYPVEKKKPLIEPGALPTICLIIAALWSIYMLRH